MKCMRLWASGSVHQRVPRRSSLADRRPHTGPRQHTCERVHLPPHPLYRDSFKSTRTGPRQHTCERVHLPPHPLLEDSFSASPTCKRSHHSPCRSPMRRLQLRLLQVLPEGRVRVLCPSALYGGRRRRAKRDACQYVLPSYMCASAASKELGSPRSSNRRAEPCLA